MQSESKIYYFGCFFNIQNVSANIICKILPIKIPKLFSKTFFHSVLLLLLLKKVGNARLGESD